jgi:hypothetical protein
MPRQIQVETSKALQEHFPTLLTSGLQTWAATIQQNHDAVLGLQNRSADTYLEHMKAHNELILSSTQSQNRAGIEAANILQTTLKGIGATIKNTVAAHPVYQALAIRNI